MHLIYHRLKICLISSIFSFLSFTHLYSQNDELLRNLLWKDFLSLSTKRPKIALVLGGGGARGLSHIGILKTLEEKKIPIDIIVGTSVGALVGGLYASGMKVEDLEKMGNEIGWSKISNLSLTKLFTLIMVESLLSTEKLEKYLEKYIGDKKFEELKISFACIACDIKTGERIVFKDGEVAFACRVSATIPGVFSLVEYRHRLLVDGGIVDNLPVDIAKVMGADFIIAVYPRTNYSTNKTENVITTLSQVINIQGGFLMEKQMKTADFLLITDVKDVGMLELDKSQQCIESGVISGRLKVNELKDKILERFIDKIVFKE
ncbi:MAG: patatin-like phospholipase family protein [Elusimicrobiota bacterium]